jgi:Flp pilus assembly protein TadD
MLLKRMNRVVEEKRNVDSARVVFANLSGINPNGRSIYVSIAVAWAGLREKAEALQALGRVDSVTQNKNSLNIGYCYMLLGDHEGALRYLEKYSSASKRTTVFRLRLNPFWDPLRANPGFARITAIAENR